MFGGLAGVQDWVLFSGDVQTLEGVITSPEVPGRRAWDYTFQGPTGQTHTGTSFSSDQLPTGAPVTVEFLADRPEISRIKGMSRAPFSGWIMLLIGIFPAIGVVFVVIGVREGLKGDGLLRHGRFAYGKLVGTEGTNTYINEEQVMALTFEFTAHDGQNYRAAAKTHEPKKLEDEAQERLLYDPQDPSHAVVIDNLPGAGKVNGMGNLEAVDFKPLLCLIGPGVFVVCNAVVAWLLLA